MFGFANKQPHQDAMVGLQETEITEEEIRYWLIHYFLNVLNRDTHEAYGTSYIYDSETFGRGEYEFNKNKRELGESDFRKYVSDIEAIFREKTKDLSSAQIAEYDSILKEAYKCARELFNEGYRANTGTKKLAKRNEAIRKDSAKPEGKRRNFSRRTINIPASILGIMPPEQVIIFGQIPELEPGHNSSAEITATTPAVVNWDDFEVSSEKTHPIIPRKAEI